jgi:hypothetical protein
MPTGSSKSDLKFSLTSRKRLGWPDAYRKQNEMLLAHI